MKFKKTIGVVDDHLIFRKGLIGLFKEHKHIETILEAENGRDLLEKLKMQQPDIIFLDVDMPHMNGIDTTIHLKEKFPSIKIIILTSNYDEELMYHMIEYGVHGFFSKNASLDDLLNAIQSVTDKGYCFNFDATKAMVKGIVLNNKIRPEFRSLKLSGREVEILKLICKEHTNREIADKLCLSMRTIDTYRDRIFEKTGVKNAVGLVFYALKYGLVDM
ncbi:MAG: response regulator [Bacteroidia bacterium]